MSDTRVYVSLTPAQVRDLGSGSVDASSLPAFAVTPQLREALPAGPNASEAQEEWENRAMQDAAAAGAAPVCVTALDVPAAAVDPGPMSLPAQVTLTGRIALDQVVSFHVGDAGVQPQPDEEIELSWYDVTELDDVVVLLGG